MSTADYVADHKTANPGVCAGGDEHEAAHVLEGAWKSEIQIIENDLRMAQPNLKPRVLDTKVREEMARRHSEEIQIFQQYQKAGCIRCAWALARLTGYDPKPADGGGRAWTPGVASGCLPGAF